MHNSSVPHQPAADLHTSPGQGRSPSAPRALAWLFDSELCDARGRVLSWLNQRNPGYVYPEIMGYYASLCADQARRPGGARWLDRGRRVGRALVAELSPAGGLGRAGIDYSFDTGIGLCGLARVDQLGGHGEFRPAIARMRDFLVKSLEQRVVAWKGGSPVTDDTSWSLSFGASALKTGIALDMAADVLGDPAARELAGRVAREVLAGCLRGGRICINPQRDWVYAHAHCYALEGLCALSARGLADASPIAPASAWLASVQNTDGSITNYHGRSDAKLGKQGDATSQAVRIWCAVDRAGFAPNIVRGLDFLAGLQTPEGGLRYAADSDDVNSWVTMFAAQACQWAQGEAAMEWVL